MRFLIFLVFLALAHGAPLLDAPEPDHEAFEAPAEVPANEEQAFEASAASEEPIAPDQHFEAPAPEPLAPESELAQEPLPEELILEPEIPASEPLAPEQELIVAPDSPAPGPESSAPEPDAPEAPHPLAPELEGVVMIPIQHPDIDPEHSLLDLLWAFFGDSEEEPEVTSRPLSAHVSGHQVKQYLVKPMHDVEGEAVFMLWAD